jgi:hypothetical protein
VAGRETEHGALHGGLGVAGTTETGLQIVETAFRGFLADFSAPIARSVCPD